MKLNIKTGSGTSCTFSQVLLLLLLLLLLLGMPTTTPKRLGVFAQVPDTVTRYFANMLCLK
jgi:hypothetical protein